MKNLMLFGAVLIVGFLAVSAGQMDTGNVTAEPVWQYSQGTSITLGVRNKVGTLKNYCASFVVRNEDRPNKNYKTVTLDIEADDWGFVRFPEDFGYGSPGNYVWQCIVEGKVVAKGKFKLPAR